MGGSAARGGRKEIWFALLANFSGRYGVCYLNRLDRYVRYGKGMDL